MSSIDELMWLIADEGDASAIDSFSKRHPEYHGELMRRINMVRDIKGTRPEAPAMSIPAFSPRPISEPKRVNRWVWTAAAAAILAGSAFAGFYGIGRLIPSNRGTSTDPTVSQNPPPTLQPNRPNNLQGVTPPGFDPNQNVVPPQPAPQNLASWQKHVDLHFKSISIVELFNEITRQTGLKIEIGPGLLPADIPVELSDVTAIAALKGLGEMYGFTVFEQDMGSVLIIPAVDPTEVPMEGPDEDSREGTPPVKVDAPAADQGAPQLPAVGE